MASRGGRRERPAWCGDLAENKAKTEDCRKDKTLVLKLRLIRQ